MPLSLAKNSQDYQITRIGGKRDIKRHLYDLGFVEGTPIKLVSSINGDVIVEVKNTRIALNKEMAKRIYI